MWKKHKKVGYKRQSHQVSDENRQGGQEYYAGIIKNIRLVKSKELDGV